MKKKGDRTVVLDASAMLAVIQNESGAEAVLGVLDDGSTVLVSSVNLSEVGTKLVRDGLTSAEVEIGVNPFIDFVVGFDLEQALVAAELYRITKPHGLSLGDRACIALARSREGVVLTADSSWSQVNAGVRVQNIRSASV